MGNLFSMGRTTNEMGSGPSHYNLDPDNLGFLRDKIVRNQLDFNGMWVGLGFGTLYGMFLVMAMSSRRRRISTAYLGTLLIFTVLVLVYGFMDNNWYVAGRDDFSTTYCLRSPAKIQASLTVSVGLTSFNVSYVSRDKDMEFSYAENFEFQVKAYPDFMMDSVKVQALKRGLPNPITVVAEYFSFENTVGEFEFARSLKQAGYYTNFMLTCSTVVAVIGAFLTIVTPRYGVAMHCLVGGLLVVSAMVYHSYVVGLKHNTIYVEGVAFSFHLGHTFFLVLTAGMSNLATGALVPILIKYGPCSKISTTFELDYDTPWSHQMLKEDSKRRKEVELASPKGTEDSNFSPFVFDRNSFFRRSVQKIRNSMRIANKPTQPVVEEEELDAISSTSSKTISQLSSSFKFQKSQSDCSKSSTSGGFSKDFLSEDEPVF